MKTDASCVSTAKSTPQCRVKIHETNVKFLIDSGATINLLDPRDFRAMSRRRNILLTPTRTKVKAFGSDRPIELSGKFDAVVETKKRMVVATFYVTKQESGSLLSCSTSVELGLLQFPSLQTGHSCRKQSEATKSKKVVKTETTRNHIPAETPQTPVVPGVKNEVKCKYEQTLRAKYPAVFEGIGKLNGYAQKLHFDESIPPVSQTHRRTPFHLRKQLDTWLENYQTNDIIEPVINGRTDWVSGLVVAPKPRNPKEVRVVTIDR